MHISEGVLTAPILGAGVVLSLGGMIIGLKRMNYEKLPEVGVLSSAFFVASLVHVPIGPSAAHLVLNGICGLLLGWMAFPAIFVGLALQAILFGFGGVTTLGVNTFNMAFPAVVLGYGCRHFLNRPNPAVRGAAVFIAGAGSIFLSGLMVAACLVLALGDPMDTAARLVVLAHIPIMLVEGAVTVFVLEFIRKVRPEILLKREALREST